MLKVVFVRHGESVWNKKNLFCGWVDVGLSKRGEKEAQDAAKVLKKNKYKFDVVFESVLRRATKTTTLILENLSQNIVRIRSWRLNERHYGGLQGSNKRAMTRKFGEDQVFQWRRSYNIQPPRIKKGSRYDKSASPKYRGVRVPMTECLADVVGRAVPYWQKAIIPAVRSGKRVLVSAHGNSIRAIIKHIDHVSNSQIVGLNIPYAMPLVYEFDKNMNPIRHYYLGDAKKIKALTKEIANQAKVN